MLGETTFHKLDTYHVFLSMRLANFFFNLLSVTG
jgi:hypothetical protein